MSEHTVRFDRNTTGTGVLEGMALADTAFNLAGVGVKARMSERAFLAALSRVELGLDRPAERL